MNYTENLFFRFSFHSDSLCIGERIKKGTFRPCIDVLPCSTVMGFLFSNLGWHPPSAEEPLPICAVGGKIYGERNGEREILTFAPSDIGRNVAKIPLTIEYLSNAKAEFFVKKTKVFNNPDILLAKLEKNRLFSLGAFTSKGFGRCEITKVETYEAKHIEKEGILNSRIYADQSFLPAFGIQTILKPRYGYLFRKESMETGYYQKSIFEGSRILHGFDFLFEEDLWNDLRKVNWMRNWKNSSNKS